MFNKVLIANRGEIAVRIIRTCKEMGIKTVAVYSELDRDSLHVLLADESVCIGRRSSQESYLNIANILSVASLYDCDAIHPGVGFLSENAKFARICEAVGIQLIGPGSHIIEMMGNKSKARQIMEENNIPIVPGTDTIQTIDDGKQLAQAIGYPILIKASAGGGGKGMRICQSPEMFEEKFFAATTEAKNAFGNGQVYIEKLIENPRHIEIQILSDRHGNVIHLGERDCSIQRNHQKMIEESPSVIIDERLRKTLGAVATKAAKVIDYENAGTVEFLVDKDKNYYFIEMNTRIQVEHPVTEMITGIDLIQEQLKVAADQRLSVQQEDIEFNGHAIEVRINAEDPKNNFIPSPGTIELKCLPGGRNVRFDSFIYNDYTIPPAYDSLLGKLIVKGKTRQEAISRMTRALSELSILGIETTIEFIYQIFQDEQFITSNYDTSYIENYLTREGDLDA